VEIFLQRDDYPEQGIPDSWLINQQAMFLLGTAGLMLDCAAGALI